MTADIVPVTSQVKTRLCIIVRFNLFSDGGWAIHDATARTRLIVAEATTPAVAIFTTGIAAVRYWGGAGAFSCGMPLKTGGLEFRRHEAFISSEVGPWRSPSPAALRSLARPE